MRASCVRRRVGHNEMEKTKERATEKEEGEEEEEEEGRMLLVLSARLCCICSMHAHFLLRVNARLISLHLFGRWATKGNLCCFPPEEKKSYMMELFPLAPVVFGESGSEIHPVLFSVRPLLAAAMKRIVFWIFPLLLPWPFDIFVAVDRFPKGRPTLAACACDVNSYDGCASDVRYTIHVPHVP